MVFSRILCDSIPLFLGLSISLSVGMSVSHFTFVMIFIFLAYGLCPNGLVTSNMAPAHSHATGVAVYPALFLNNVYFVMYYCIIIIGYIHYLVN